MSTTTITTGVAVGVLVVKPVKGRLQLRMPYTYGTRYWLSDELACRPVWDGQRWRIARRHFAQLLHALWSRYGQAITVVVEGHESERCDVRCQNAHGDDCVCSCAGAHHGEHSSRAGWRQVGETTLIASAGIVRQLYIWTPGSES